MRVRWRGLELPMRVVCDQDSLTPTYGLFTAEPFERGFGTTIGNSLRRILLSSIEGSAVAWVKIKGVQHEFSTIPGVVEDVTEIMLNIKQLNIKLHTEDPRIVKIEKKKAGAVTAADIQADANVEIVDPEQHIALLTEDTDFSAEMEVRRGRGYVTAEENADEDQVIGVIPVDSLFSPVRRVRYRTEDTRVGQKTNYDRLVMEIWTNGIVEPEMALVEASKILRKHLNPFVHYFEIGDELPPVEQKAVTGVQALLEGLQPVEDERLSRPVAELDLSVRASNCLEAEHIDTIGDLVAMSPDELMNIKNFGRTSLKEIQARLAEIGLSLKAGEEETEDEEE